MVMMPAEETIPYHLGWAGFALAFALGTWSRRQLVAALAWYTFATGVVLIRSWLVGNISWDETTEIPLMFLLALLMVWNVLRRQGALTEVRRLAEREVQTSHDRERLTQLTSHELRTPLTIARGYVELIQARAVEPEDLQDLLVVVDELDRLSRVSDRLIRMIRLQDGATSELVDIDAILAQSLERWRVVAVRNWVLDTDAGQAQGSPERLRTGIDTLVENAIRYTSVGDTIRLVGSRGAHHVAVAVFDSGAGLTDQQMAAINSEGQPSPSESTTRAGMTAGSCAPLVDPLAGTGLGLSIVRQVVHARGGTLRASRAPQGGAALTMSLPLDPHAGVRRLGVGQPRSAAAASHIQCAPPPERSHPASRPADGQQCA
ncbi:MAG: two-component system, OmpR family, sensor kinase [Actinomycetota bacterium]|nr:two-component system, OmpR family, sensor kinase [Actinomycetota bacterium]